MITTRQQSQRNLFSRSNEYAWSNASWWLLGWCHLYKGLSLTRMLEFTLKKPLQLQERLLCTGCFISNLGIRRSWLSFLTPQAKWIWIKLDDYRLISDDFYLTHSISVLLPNCHNSYFNKVVKKKFGCSRWMLQLSRLRRKLPLALTVSLPTLSRSTLKSCPIFCGYIHCPE